MSLGRFTSGRGAAAARRLLRCLPRPGAGTGRTGTMVVDDFCSKEENEKPVLYGELVG